MDKKRTMILFGAGALIPWGGPETSYLTEIVKKNSATEFVCEDGQTKIIEYIYNALKNSGYKDEEINFETLINVIEEFIIYHSYFDNKKELPSLNKVFFSSRFEEIIKNFSIKEGQLETPKGKKYHFSKSAYNNESPEQIYFQHLLSELLTDINAEVPNCAEIDKPENQILNSYFQKWLQFISKESIIRMYTLNYDRIFKMLAEKAGLSVFEGFECSEFIPQNGVDEPDIIKILTDFNCDIHYNLHGSAFWEVNSRDENSELFNPWISLKPYRILEMNNHESAILQMEKGKSILISNIITGFQKTQKSFITPFKQMQSAFDKDCCLANELLVIGYSFGDSHINASIKTALRYNPGLKLHFIDPAYCEKDGKKGYELLVKRFIHIFPEILNNERTQPLYSDGKDTCIYFNNKLTVTAIGFEEYLNRFYSLNQNKQRPFTAV